MVNGKWYMVKQSWTLNNARWKLHTLHCTLQTAQCTLHTAYWKLRTAHYTLKTAQRTLQTAHCTLHTWHYTMHNAQFRMHNAQWPWRLQGIICLLFLVKLVPIGIKKFHNSRWKSRRYTTMDKTYKQTFENRFSINLLWWLCQYKVSLKIPILIVQK